MILNHLSYNDPCSTNPQPIGAAAAATSGQHVAAMLGAVPGAGPCQERINATIASMTPMQIFEVMSQVRRGPTRYSRFACRVVIGLDVVLP